jgi:hypothetical protein
VRVSHLAWRLDVFRFIYLISFIAFDASFFLIAPVLHLCAKVSRLLFSVSGTRTPDEVVAKVKTFRAQDASGLMSTVKTDLSAKSAPPSAGATAASGSCAAAASASAASKSSPSLSASAAPDASVESVSEEDDWTSSEQKALEVRSCSCSPNHTIRNTFFRWPCLFNCLMITNRWL